MDAGRERYVSLTTYRSDGSAVATPVWVAPLDDGRLGCVAGGGTRAAVIVTPAAAGG